VWDADAERVQSETLKCHPLVIAACQQRNHVPPLHGPLNPAVDPTEACTRPRACSAGPSREVPAGVARRSVVRDRQAVARRQRNLVADVAERLPELERLVMSSDLQQP
jgi:hypothetical protein